MTLSRRVGYFPMKSQLQSNFNKLGQMEIDYLDNVPEDVGNFLQMATDEFCCLEVAKWHYPLALSPWAKNYDS
jgi:hypothetical protein